MPLIEAIGDIWNYPNREVICITTNGIVNANGCLVMGKGVALQAKERVEGLDRLWGSGVKRHGNKPILYMNGGPEYKDSNNRTRYPSMLSFPTKHNWKDKSDIELIKASAAEIVRIAEGYRWTTYVMTRPGCGNGGLDWDKEVKPAIKPIFDKVQGVNFVVLTP